MTTDVPLQALTIYLLRELPDPRNALIRPGSLRRIQIDQDSTVYVKRSKPHFPSWASFFAGRVDAEEFGKVRSSGALLLCASRDRWFAVTFGTGRYLLDPLCIEQRFGLLVTLNAVDPKKVRSIDTASLDRQGMQSRTQASRDASARDFGLDIEQDLLRAVAGTPSDPRVGETIAGFDALHVNVRIGLTGLKEQLGVYLEKSKEKTYQKEFGWIDHVWDVRDATVADRLTRHLMKEMKRGATDNIWLAPDGIIDWNAVSTFQFGGARSAPRYPVLSLDRWIESVGGARKLNAQALTKRVQALRADDSIAHEWPVLRCLQAEVQLDDKSYLLSAGKWYEVDHDFVDRIDAIVRAIPVDNLGLPEYQDKSEGAYNERVVSQSEGRLALLDKDNIRYGGGQGQIEFCDLYSRERDLIHLKRYSSSATLSHLFSQAAVSGESFKSDVEFRRKVNGKLPTAFRLADVARSPDPDQFRVVLGIIGGPAETVKLPFFSRVTLKNSFSQLRAYGYRVAVSHIPLEERFARLSELREKEKRRHCAWRARAGGPAPAAAARGKTAPNSRSRPGR